MSISVQADFGVPRPDDSPPPIGKLGRGHLKVNISPVLTVIAIETRVALPEASTL